VPLYNSMYGVLDASGAFAVQPPDGLQQFGPTAGVVVSASADVAALLTSEGQGLPNPEIGLALVDTGAAFTAVDEDAARRMGLSPVAVIPIVSATHTVQAPVYAISLAVPAAPAFHLDLWFVVGVNLAPQGLLMLIGRDLLRVCQLTYNGVAGTICVAW
jgi:hypothetical protein